MMSEIKFILEFKPYNVWYGNAVVLYHKPVEGPFPIGTHVTLTTGETGTIYEDGHGFSSYLRDDGIVYVHFLPDDADDLDDVVSLPLSRFGDFEIIVKEEE